MSHATPTTTPSRRRQAAMDTPGSARSTTSTDRASLAERLEDIEMQVRDLKRQLHVERERRASSSARKREKEKATTSSDATSYLTTITNLGLAGRGRTETELKELLSERLKNMDDNALTTLLTASPTSLAQFIASSTVYPTTGRHSEKDASNFTFLSIDAGLVPSKSVGIEGVGSGTDIDRRLLLLNYDSSSIAEGTRSERRNAAKEEVQEGLRRSRHNQSVNAWLKDRQKRSTSLIEGLRQFTFLDIESVKQTESRGHRREAIATMELETEAASRRSIHIKGMMAKLFPMEIRFDVVEAEQGATSADTSPRIQDLDVTLPTWLRKALDQEHNHLTRLIRRNDLPAVLLTLRTMIPLLSLRRNLFTSLMERYVDLVRDQVKSWESINKVEFQPWHPPNPSNRNRVGLSGNKSIDENLAKSLIVPQQAESFTLQNSKQAALTITFKIRFNRFGHATPQIQINPKVPSHLTNPTAAAFLRTFDENFQHLLKVSISQDGEIRLPDQEDEDEVDESIGKFGILPAINATIGAFFGLHTDEDEEEDEEEEEE